MKRASFEALDCSMAQALELIGEWWTLLIIREAYFGTRRFSDFQSQLGIARNVLADRLDRLVESGLLRREPVAPGAKREHYRLTEKSRDLLTVVVALVQWGDRWVHGRDRAPVSLIDRETGQEIADLEIRSKDGRPLMLRDIGLAPGPGANADTEARFRETVAETGPVRWRVRRHLAP